MKRLVAGCGKHTVRQEDDVFVDIREFEGVDIVLDLNKPWDMTENHFDEVLAVHVVEHLDSLIHFMDEAWKVLRPGGVLKIETPLAGGDIDLEMCDPTHKRCYRRHSFLNYFTVKGIEKFGYTDKAWHFPVCEVDSKQNLIVEGIPMKN